MSNKRKILIVGPELSLPGGVAHHIKTLLSSPLNKEHKLDYFKVGPKLNDSRAKIIIKFIFNPFRFLWKLLKFWPDVVHFNPSFDTKSLLREFIMIAICKIHGHATLVQLHGGNLAVLMRKGHLHIYIRLIFKWASHLVLLTNIQKKPLLKYCAADRLSVIPNMIDTKVYCHKKQNNNSRYRILYMSKIELKKGAFDVLESIHLVLKRFSNVKFIFAGDGPDKNKLQLLCCENEFEDSVKFLGYLKDQKKLNFLSRGDIFLFPSHYNEGMPYALLEAMASGLPVIATTVGGVPEIIEPLVNGFLVPPQQPKKLARAINKLLASYKIRKKIGDINRYKAETEYDIKVVCEKFDKLYKKLSNFSRF